jgi:hypothetical protein
MKKLIFFLLLSMVSLDLIAQNVDTTICPGDTLRLNAFSTGASSYRWYKDNQLLSGEDSNILVVTGAGTYYAKGISAKGCVSGPSFTVNVKQEMPFARDDSFIVAGNRKVKAFVLRNDLPGCNGFENATLSVINFPSGGTVKVNADHTISYEAKPYASGKDSFTYKITDQKGFSTNTAMVWITIDPACAAVYPNPVHDIVNITINNRFLSRLRLVEPAGTVLYQISVLNRPDIQIDMSGFASGLYFIQLLDADGNLNCVFKITKKGP